MSETSTASRVGAGFRWVSDFGRRHSRGVVLVMIIVAFVLTIGLLVFRSAPSRPVTQASQGKLELNFGLSRQPITRSLRFDLCTQPNSDAYVECAPTGKEPQRPEIQSASLESDLVSDDGEQYPVSQFTLDAVNVGQSGVLINVNANPASPDDVPPGTYRGEVLIDRAGEPHPIPIMVQAVLEPRTGDVATRASMALALGAFAGTLLKWLDDSFSPLAALRRKQRRLEQFLRTSEPNLPEGVRLRLLDVQDALKRFDPEGIGTSLDDISKNQDALIAFAGAGQFLQEQLRVQAILLGQVGASSALAVSAYEAEQEALRDLRATIWPWAEAESVKSALATMKRQSQSLTRALQRFARTGTESDRQAIISAAADILELDGSTAQEEETNPPAGAGESKSSAASSPRPPWTDASVPLESTGIVLPPRRTVGLWLLDNAWWLTLVVTALVVVFWGYQSQFLDDPAFEGDATDYFKMAAWALAVQLAGGTILETMGRLRTSRTAT